MEKGQISETFASNSRLARQVARQRCNTGIYKCMRLISTLGLHNVFSISNYFLQRPWRDLLWQRRQTTSKNNGLCFVLIGQHAAVDRLCIYLWNLLYSLENSGWLWHIHLMTATFLPDVNAFWITPTGLSEWSICMSFGPWKHKNNFHLWEGSHVFNYA